jgi:transcriptional regulator with XRE-family HTH domain
MTQIPTRSPFGDKLRFYRGQTVDRNVGKPLSQEKFALRISEQIGLIISRNIISNWENGKSDLHPKKDRFLLTAIVATLHRYRGIATLDEANHLLEAGDYRALDEKEVSTINPEWIPSMIVRGSEQGLKNEISIPSATHRSVNVRSPITLNIEAKESLPIVIHTPISSLGKTPSPPSLIIGREADRSKTKENPSVRVVDKSKITIQILIAINA